MEIVSAVVSLIGGALQLFGINRQASAAETIAFEREKTARAWFDTIAEGWKSQERIAEIRAWFGRDVAWEEGDVQRTRIFYNYQALTNMKQALIAAAGVSLLGIAVYLGLKEEE